MKEIQLFLEKYHPEYNQEIVQLTSGGSGRQYFRAMNAENSSIIVCKNPNPKENKVFCELTHHLSKNKNWFPEVFQLSENQEIYSQSDLGNQTLLELKQQNGETDDVKKLYQQTLVQLAQTQVEGIENWDIQSFYDFKQMDEMVVFRDLFYFKNCLLDLITTDYVQHDLLSDFKQLANLTATLPYQYLMYRDFQGRNVMIKGETPYFIDYQGAMKGPIAYDVVSLLWQAKAELSDEWKNDLLEVYMQEAQKHIADFNREEFLRSYEICLILRLLQVLGAYGFLGLMQNKPHFKQSLVHGLENLKVLQTSEILQSLPTLYQLVLYLCDDDIIESQKI